MLSSILFAVFSIIFCLLFCWCRSKQANIYSLMLKIASSMCFILCGVFAVHTIGSNSVNLLVVVGLVMGLIGDILLDLKLMHPEQNGQYFVCGTASFMIAHLFYFLAIVFFNNANLPTHLGWNILASIGVATVLTTAIILPSKKLGLNFEKQLPISIAYCFILTFMVAISVSIAIFVPIFWIFASGMICFFLSDLVLSMQYFGGREEKVWIFVNHILYYLAQTLIAFSLLYLVI